jgi:hypothetical protein
MMAHNLLACDDVTEAKRNVSIGSTAKEGTSPKQYQITWSADACVVGGASDALCASCATWGACREGGKLFPWLDRLLFVEKVKKKNNMFAPISLCKIIAHDKKNATELN